jgi:metallo-beta-lactamase class B
VLKDGDKISLGNITMTAHLGAGHTQGATTWTTTVQDGGRSYNIVFPCCTTFAGNYHLVVNPTYPGIADDFRNTFSMLESLHPDIWLAAHTQFFGFEQKRARAVHEGVSAWVDPDGYRAFIAKEKAGFESRLATEK